MLTIELTGIKAVTDRFEAMTERIEQLKHHDLSHELGRLGSAGFEPAQAVHAASVQRGITVIRAHRWFEIRGRRKVMRRFIRRRRYTRAGHQGPSCAATVRPIGRSHRGVGGSLAEVVIPVLS